MTQSQIKNTFFIALFILIFFIELALFAILQKHIIYPLLCFFIPIINQRPSTRLIAIAIFLMALTSYLDYNIFGWNLIYIIPIMIVSRYFDKQFHVKFVIPYILLLIALFIKASVSHCLLAIDSSVLSNFYIFFCNTIMLAFCIGIYFILEVKFQLTPGTQEF